MQTLLIKIEENLKTQFVAQAILGRSKAIRKGYYFIEDVNYEQIGIAGEVAVAKVNWNPHDAKSFLEETRFTICLDSLYNEASIGPKDTAPVDLKGKFISIGNIEQRNQFRFGQDRKVLVANWEIISAQATFLNSQNIVLYSLSNGTTNPGITDMWNNFASSAPYDVNQAINDEANVDALDYDGDPDDAADF